MEIDIFNDFRSANDLGKKFMAKGENKGELMPEGTLTSFTFI